MIMNTSYLTLNVPERKITPLAAKLRFTVLERIAIRELSKTNGYVEDFVDLLNTGYCVDLSRTDFRDGLMFLKSVGLLTDERVVEILTAPTQEHEMYRGI